MLMQDVIAAGASNVVCFEHRLLEKYHDSIHDINHDIHDITSEGTRQVAAGHRPRKEGEHKQEC